MAHILVVDDDRAVLDTLVELIQGAGFTVTTARNGRQALGLIEREPFDLVVLDVLIPHINGFALMEQVRANPALRDLPVMMLSGIYRARNHRTDMMEKFGVVDYLDKPVDPQRLLDAVRAAVAGRDTSANLPRITTTEPALPAMPVDEPAPADPSRPEIDDRQDNIDKMLQELLASADKLVEPAATDEKREVESAARSSFKQSAFLSQGSLKKTPVATVLGRLWHQRASGALLLRHDNIKKILYVDEGSVYFVKSNLVSECLGRLLVRERLITADQCQASIDKMRDTGKRQGELLVAMTAITEKNLTFALELQLETKIFDTFNWEQGEYRFNPSVALPATDVEIEWKGGALVVEGIRRAFTETRLRTQMLPVLEVPLAFRDETMDFAAQGFTKAELSGIAAIRPGMTTQQLLDRLPLDPPDTLRVLYSLIALDLLVPAP